MHDKAFTFQTLRPDTIIDGLFDLGMRVDSGLTPLNSYENRVYQFQDEERHRYVVKFYRPERWSAEQILEEHQFALQLVEVYGSTTYCNFYSHVKYSPLASSVRVIYVAFCCYTAPDIQPFF
ncbi:phosphotransferase, partial [Klebsiella pneumoniae]|uniref:phosphotransferase n=1 Tax=Klebsiella pneumoniae TaxID=573 RepID=UPI003AEC2946